MSQQPSPMLAAAIEAAEAAAVVIRAGYSSNFEVTTKADMTPVTTIDVQSEHAIRDVIASRFPDHGFFGEETGRSDRDSPYLWLVDPIDGTKAFVRQYPFFSTQIALMHEGRIVLGVSSAPLYGEMMWAERGAGAWMNQQRLQVSDIAQLELAAISLGNVHTMASGAQWSKLGALVARCSRIRGYGDFLHYHLLSAGKLEAVIESDVNILDIAALSVIVEEAGGLFTDLQGRPPALDTTTVLAGNPAMHALLTTLLQV